MPPLLISLIEDDASTRATWRSWLKPPSEFICSAEFATAEDALLGWNDRLANVVLVDLRLPAMNGAECVRRLKQRFPALDCLMLTVVNDSNAIFEALKAGASGYLLKSATRQELLQAIRNVRDGGAAMSPAIGRKVLQFFSNPAVGVLEPLEVKILQRFTKGQKYFQVARELELTDAGLCNRVRKIYEKLHASNQSEAIAKFVQAYPWLNP